MLKEQLLWLREFETVEKLRVALLKFKELYNREHYEQLILIASPRFLGMLRNQLPGPLARLVARTIDKDLTTASVDQIIAKPR